MTTGFQENLYTFISEHLACHGYSPSFREIIEALGISAHSKSLITRSLRALEKEGKLILKKEGRRLLISLRAKGLPLLGRISAGTPIEAIAEHEFIDIGTLFQGADCFALQVKGTSMIDEGIMDGDLIICRKAEAAREGDIAVVLIDRHNTTLKRISYQMKDLITLVPANAALKPRAYPPERIAIQGIYIGLLRLSG